jgi:hypothetical protein
MSMCNDTCTHDGLKLDYESVIVANVVDLHNDLLDHFSAKRAPRPITIAAAILFINRISVANVDDFATANAIVSTVERHLGESPDGE